MAKAPIPETAPLQSRISLKQKYKALIALPSCHEFESLPETLKSLELCGAQYIEDTLIIVNVNQRASADSANNIKTLEWLENFDTPLQLAWLDHSNAPFAYTEKFGVGLARHQACSSGYDFLNNKAPIISLDGDSPVNENYLKAIYSHLENNKNFGAGHVTFKHRNCGTPEEKEAIRLYEKHLHQHRRNLEKACSPHAWYAIGSTIVCTKEAYQKAGGYNCRRMAGEDFYLLQQLSKIGCTIAMIEEAFVYPADRESQRVPFGTGKAIGDIIQDGNFMTYHPDCYKDLKELLATIRTNLNEDTATVLKEAPDTCLEYLQERKFDQVWPKLQNNSRDNKMLLQRFHEWLDAFQTLKLIHHLSDKYYPRIAID